MKQETKCPVCHSIEFKYLFSIDKGKLVRCLDCELTYYTPRPSQEELHEFYSTENYRCEFAQSLMSGKDFAERRYLQFAKALQKYTPQIFHQESRQLLDIGCGTGDFLKIAKQHDWYICGTEISDQASIQANKVLQENCVITGDILSLDIPPNSYDAITLYHVIEHVLNPNLLIQKIHQLLKPDGVFFLETPNIGGFGAVFKGKRWSQIKPPEHILYFNPRSLKYCLKQSGFSQSFVFTSSPSIIESTKSMPLIQRQIVNSLYATFPLINMGALLQSISVKSQ